MDSEGFDPKRHWRMLAGWACVAAGLLFVLLGWFGVSGTPSVARQLPYLASGGVGGLALVIVGAGLLISEDIRNDRRRLGRIESALLDLRDVVASTDEDVSGSTTSRRRSR